MRFSVLAAAAIASTTSAWRLDIFQNSAYGGHRNSYSGPGREGWACHSVTDLNGEAGRISSYKFWNDAPGNGYCCLELYDSPGCPASSGFGFTYWTCDTRYQSSLGNINDDISSFATSCYN